MSARRPDEVKAAVMAALITGQGVCEIAAEYQIPKQTVSRWKELAIAKLAENGQTLRDVPGRRKTLAEQLDDLLETAIGAAKAGMQQAHNEEWRNRQSAAELGTFVGIVVDKAVRLFDAAERAAALFASTPGEAE